MNWWELDVYGQVLFTCNADPAVIHDAPHHFCSLTCLGAWANAHQAAHQTGAKGPRPARATVPLGMNLRLNYVLDGHVPRPARDWLEWSEWWANADRQVADDAVALPSGSTARVSTVFLGVDHNFEGSARGPVLFETMVFYTKAAKGMPAAAGEAQADEEICERYRTWDEALAGHAAVLGLVRMAVLDDLSVARLQ